MDVVNMPVLETISRKLYGLIKAFQDCRTESDWKMPKGGNSKSWKTKVRWTLLDEYDVEKLDNDDWPIDAVDDEVKERMTRKALFAKSLAKVEEAAPTQGPPPDA